MLIDPRATAFARKDTELPMLRKSRTDMQRFRMARETTEVLEPMRQDVRTDMLLPMFSKSNTLILEPRPTELLTLIDDPIQI
jgi:hypothetical protein